MPQDTAHHISLPSMFDHYGDYIQGALRSNLDLRHSAVYDMLRYYVGWADVTGAPITAMTGKAVRPTLCLFGCEAVGGAVNLAMPAAVALEFIHNFSLVHDDIQDEDETRHNRKTLWRVWGKPKALVAGNVLRVVADTALHKLESEGLKPDRSLIVVSLLTESYLEMIEGQYLDMSFEGRHDIGMDDYLRMISRKTGSLIRCSLNLGAAVGTDDPHAIAALRECGRALGYVFQIRDDALGVWGKEEITGKPVGSDIRRKKNSYPVVYTMEAAASEDRASIYSMYQKPELDDDDVDSVLRIMDRVGAREHAQSEAARWADAAVRAIAPLELSHQHREQIEEFTHFLLVRDR